MANNTVPDGYTITDASYVFPEFATGSITNDGASDVILEFDKGGATPGSPYTLKTNEVLSFPPRAFPYSRCTITNAGGSTIRAMLVR